MQEQQENSDDAIKWSTNGLHQYIRSIEREMPLATVETISIYAILKSSLYMWHKIKGEKTLLTTKELVDFISLINFMTLAMDETLNYEDREFVKMHLDSLPGFQYSLGPERQPESLKNYFSAAQLLIILDHTDR